MLKRSENMNLEMEFDSEFCNVKYMEKDNIVFLTWKKFCSFEDYRKPTTFALELLRKHANSQFVFDSRNGFEDDKADVEWGFSFLLPEMSKTDCKCVSFILEEANEIQDEMNLWTKEMGKYFAIRQVQSYEEAVKRMNRFLLVHVVYTIKPGARDLFLEQVEAQGIIQASKEEPGNYKYAYYKPIEKDNQLFLMEMWVSEAAQKRHGHTAHYEKLQELKKQYVTETVIEKYQVNLS